MIEEKKRNIVENVYNALKVFSRHNVCKRFGNHFDKSDVDIVINVMLI